MDYPVSPELERFAEKFSDPEDPLLRELYRETHLKTLYPRMLAGHLQGLFLRMICRIYQPALVLEVGTFTGYSALSMAMGLPEHSKIHTIDSNPEYMAIAVKYFERSGLASKIIPHVGNALQIIPQLEGDFDLIYLDADKENYPNYYQLLIDRLKPGGLMLADNMFWDGKVLHSDITDPETLGILDFLEYIHTDQRVEKVLLPIRDGLMLMRKRE